MGEVRHERGGSGSGTGGKDKRNEKHCRSRCIGSEVPSVLFSPSYMQEKTVILVFKNTNSMVDSLVTSC